MRYLTLLFILSIVGCSTTRGIHRSHPFNPDLIRCKYGEPTYVQVESFTSFRDQIQYLELSWKCNGSRSRVYMKIDSFSIDPIEVRKTRKDKKEE